MLNTKKPSDNLLTKPVYNLLLIAAFFEGGAVMVVELTGAKMIAPFYGTTIYVWTAVLSVTLGGLGMGYLIGGGKYFKNSGVSKYFSIYAISCIFVSIMPLMASAVLESTLEMEIRTGVMLSCFIFLFPPLFCFGLLSPILVRIIALHLNDSGKAAGKVYAISTFGGILFTLITGFYLIPNIGLKATVFTIAFLALIFPLMYFFLNQRKGKALIQILIIGVLISFQLDKLQNREKGRIKIVYKSEGIHGQLLVAEDARSKTTVLINNCISQTMYDKKTGNSAWAYVDRIIHYSNLNFKKGRVLIAGLGGGLLVKEFVKKGFTVDVVEIDGRLPDIAQKYFDCPKNTYHFINDDVRHLINCSTQKYNLIVLDLSAGESQPEYVYTVEAFKKIKNSLIKNGLLFVHFPENPSYNNNFTLCSIGKTIETAGFNTKLLNTSPVKNEFAEYMFLASNNLNKVETDNGILTDSKYPSGNKSYLEQINFTNGILLTDDRPNLEKLHSLTLLDKRKEGIKFTTKILIGDGIVMF